jgi:hypothetical protein
VGILAVDGWAGHAAPRSRLFLGNPVRSRSSHAKTKPLISDVGLHSSNNRFEEDPYLIGSPTRIRTSNLAVNSRLLYR